MENIKELNPDDLNQSSPDDKSVQDKKENEETSPDINDENCLKHPHPPIPINGKVYSFDDVM